MSMVSAPATHNEQSTARIGRAATLDVTVSIKDWLRRGTFVGANVGTILGAIFVAIPFSAEIPSFGLARAPLVGVFGCAVSCVNHMMLRRLYREERLQVSRRGGRKRALETRAPMVIPQEPNQRWSMDFVCDQLSDGRRLRIMTLMDYFTHECLALVADNLWCSAAACGKLGQWGEGVRLRRHRGISYKISFGK